MKLQKDFLLTKLEVSECLSFISQPCQYPSQFAGAMAVGLQIHRPPKILFAG